MLVVAMTLPPRIRSRTSGSTTMKLWVSQWNTPCPLVRPPMMKAARRRKPRCSSLTCSGGMVVMGMRHIGPSSIALSGYTQPSVD